MTADTFEGAQFIAKTMERHANELKEEIGAFVRDVAADQIADVAAFHQAAGVCTDPTAIDFRAGLVEEESRELAETMGLFAPAWVPLADPVPRPVNLAKLAKEAADTAYVALGSLIQLLGEPCARAVWIEVQRTNMAKFPNGIPTRRADGKITKPEGWMPPDIDAVLARFGVISPCPYCGSTSKGSEGFGTHACPNRPDAPVMAMPPMPTIFMPEDP